MNYNKYPKYKSSGIEWLGSVPKHWEICRIKYVFKELELKSENGNEDLLSVSQYSGVTKKSDKITDGAILSNAKTLTEKLAELARQLGDAAKEIDKPLDYVIDRTKDMYDDIRSAARSLRRADALGAAGHIYDAIQNARKALEVLTYKGYGGQNSVLLELIEALKQITSAGLQVKNSVYKFGNDFGNDSDSIKNTIEVSITEIDDSMNSFIQSFYSVFENMQLRLKGER